MIQLGALNPLEQWLLADSRQSLTEHARLQAVAEQQEQLRGVLRQLSAKEISTPIKPTKTVLDPVDIRTRSRKLFEFLQDQVAGHLQGPALMEYYSAKRQRARELLNIIREFNSQHEEFDLNNFLADKYPQVQESAELDQLIGFMIEAAVKTLPKQAANIQSGDKTKLVHFMEDIHALIFAVQIDKTELAKIAEQICRGNFNSLKQYGYWSEALEKFHLSKGKELEPKFTEELSANLSDWQAWLVAETLLGVLRQDSTANDLRELLIDRFSCLINIAADSREADPNALLTAIDDFNTGLKNIGKFTESEFVRVDPYLLETFTYFRGPLLESELRSLVTELATGTHGSVIEIGDKDEGQSFESEQAVMIKHLPRIYTLVTNRQLNPQQAEQMVDKFFAMNREVDKWLYSATEACLKVSASKLPGLLPKMQRHFPLIVTKLLYDSLSRQAYKVNGYNLDNLLTFMENLRQYGP